jgi:predicted nucleic acid-binding protein
MNAVDTNILIYANDSREPEKRKIAQKVSAELTDGVLLWQVACEYIAASRKLEAYGFTQQEAFSDLGYLRRAWPAVFPNWNVIEGAEDLLKNYSVSFWDSVLVSACLQAGVKTLYSEDFSDQSRENGLIIINPF